jgi:hypothetical protein
MVQMLYMQYGIFPAVWHGEWSVLGGCGAVGMVAGWFLCWGLVWVVLVLGLGLGDLCAGVEAGCFMCWCYG